MASLSPKEIAVQWYERVWNQTSKEAIREMLAPDGIAHLEGGIELRGPAEFELFHDQLLSAIPDLRLQVLRAVGDDVQACVHWQSSGTHKGELMGRAATNKAVSFTGMSFMIVRDGKIVEGWDCWDQGSVMATLSTPL